MLSGSLPVAVGDGHVKVRGGVSDTVGNRSLFGPVSVALDETAPVQPTAVSSSSAPLTNSATVPVTVIIPVDSGPSRLTVFDLRDCTATGCETHQNTITGTGAHNTTLRLADGDHAVSVRIRDRAGNIGA